MRSIGGRFLSLISVPTKKKQSGFVEMSRMGHVNSKQEVLEAFRVFDTNGQGVLSQQDMQNIVYNLGEQMSQADAQEMMQDACGVRFASVLFAAALLLKMQSLTNARFIRTM